MRRARSMPFPRRTRRPPARAPRTVRALVGPWVALLEMTVDRRPLGAGRGHYTALPAAVYDRRRVRSWVHQSWRAAPAGPAGAIYLTEPAVIPSTIWRLNTKKMTIIGMVTIDSALNSSE